MHMYMYFICNGSLYWFVPSTAQLGKSMAPLTTYANYDTTSRKSSSQGKHKVYHGY